MNVFMITILSAVSFFTCCTFKKEPQKAENMLEFYYRKTGTTRYIDSFSVLRKGVKAEIVINKNMPDERCFETGTDIFVDLQNIVDKYEMSKYRKSYLPKVEVMDGESWYLIIRYTDSENSIESSGNNAWPKNGRFAFDEIETYFNSKFKGEDSK